MADNVDQELNAYLNLDLPAEDLPEVPDAFDDFIQAQKLAGKTGWTGAENVAGAIKNIKAVRHDSTPAPQDPDRLEKAVSFYVTWLEDQMEKTAKSSAEVIEAWESDFPDASADVRGAIEQAARLIDAE